MTNPVTPDDLYRFIAKEWWSGATCESLAHAILHKFEVKERHAHTAPPIGDDCNNT
jgi:hypothetical protein